MRNPISLVALFCLLNVLAAPMARADYRKKADEQTAYIQSHFYDAAAKKYHDTYPLNPNGLPWTTMWANGVQWRLLVEATQADPAQYRPVLDAFSQGIQEYWDPKPKGSPPGFNAYCSGPGGDDKYYDDNAWMVLGFVEAYSATGDPQYWQRARDTQAFVLSGWDDKLDGGIYWSLKHQSKNTCVNAPAAVGALRLAALGDESQQPWGPRLVTWTNAHLKADDGLYWDNIGLDGRIGKAEFTYNAALMIEADVLLARTPGNTTALPDAEKIADTAITTWQDPATGAFANDSNFTHLLCESLIQLYQADHHLTYLNAVRRHAAYGYRSVRDAQNGGYWNSWHRLSHDPDERKSLLENASDGRLFWLLAPYPDVEQLYAQGMHAVITGDDVQAELLLGQAADSDTEDVEARYQWWRVLVREHKDTDAAAQQAKLVALSTDPKLKARLTAVGWTQAP